MKTLGFRYVLMPWATSETKCWRRSAAADLSHRTVAICSPRGVRASRITPPGSPNDHSRGNRDADSKGTVITEKSQILKGDDHKRMEGVLNKRNAKHSAKHHQTELQSALQCAINISTCYPTTFINCHSQ